MKTISKKTLSLARCILGAGLGAAMVLGCAATTPDETPSQNASAVSSAAMSDLEMAVAANNRFGLALYQDAVESEGGNLNLSPASISAAFALAYVGAEGETSRQIAATLHFPEDREAFVAGMKGFEALLDVDREELKIATANAAWFDNETVVQPDYLSEIATAFGASERRADFRGDPDASRAIINDWVEDRTNDRILDLLDDKAVTKETRFALVNAIYFDGKWARRFDKDSTQTDEFHLVDGSSVDVEMMRNETGLRLIEEDAFGAISLPYENGDYSLVVFLPASDADLASFEAMLTADALDGWFDALDAANLRNVDVKLPKFQARKQFRLAENLKNLGMIDPFLDGADFGAMIDPAAQPPGDQMGVKIGAVAHQTFIKVDEDGTEAAAATAVVGVVVTAMRPPPIAFHADRPFVYVMRHNKTGAVLFIGRMLDPTAM